MAFDSSLPHQLPWNYPWIKDEIERRDEYIAQLEAELAHQKPQNGAHGAIECETVKVPAEDESGAHSEPDSREKLEAEIEAYLMDNLCLDWFPCDLVSGWLDRQEAITEQECMEIREDLTADNIWMHERIAELTAEREKLTAEHERIVQEMVDANTRQCERTNELAAERDRYRAALGKAIDCADEIRRLS